MSQRDERWKAAALAALVLAVVAGCSDGPAVTNTTAAATTTMGVTSTTAAPTTTRPFTATAAAATTTSSAAPVAVGPFAEDDLPALVLAPGEGEGLVEGLEYRPGYSGPAGLSTVRHMTLVPPERLEALGFAAGRVTTFFTDPFIAEWGSAGTSLVSLALLFPTPEAAEQARQVLRDSIDEIWAEWEPLPPVQGDFPGVTGLLGTDSTEDLYPTTGFNLQVGNVVLVVGSQGGAERDDPVPEGLLRAIAEDLLSRAEARLAEIQTGG